MGDLEEVIVVPGSAFTAALEGEFIVDLTQQIESEVADQRKVGGTVPDPQP